MLSTDDITEGQRIPAETVDADLMDYEGWMVPGRPDASCERCYGTGARDWVVVLRPFDRSERVHVPVLEPGEPCSCVDAGEGTFSRLPYGAQFEMTSVTGDVWRMVRVGPNRARMGDGREVFISPRQPVETGPAVVEWLP